MSDVIDTKGDNVYEVRLNRFILARFTHTYSEGMAVCLRKASEALEGVDIDTVVGNQQRREYLELMEEYNYEEVK